MKPLGTKFALFVPLNSNVLFRWALEEHFRASSHQFWPKDTPMGSASSVLSNSRRKAQGPPLSPARTKTVGSVVPVFRLGPFDLGPLPRSGALRHERPGEGLGVLGVLAVVREIVREQISKDR